MNRKEFFENIQLDDNGNLKVVIVTGGINEDINNQFEFYSNISLTPEGYLQIKI